MNDAPCSAYALNSGKGAVPDSHALRCGACFQMADVS
jgi:hypothetical protein